jgi:Flp pilus assembly protein TadG
MARLRAPSFAWSRFRLPDAGQRGQILVLFVIALVAMLWMVRLLIDGAGAITQRRAMQDASDAAALAGVNILTDRACAENLDEVRAAVEASLAANNWGVDRATATVTCAPGWNDANTAGVTVALAANSGGLFFSSLPVTVDSTAVNGQRFGGAVSVLTLHPSRCNAFYLNGSVNLTFAAGVHVNSDAEGGEGSCNPSEAAANGKGGANVINLENGAMMYVHGEHKNINIQPPPAEGGVLADPFASYDEPSTRADLFPLPTNPAWQDEIETECVDVPVLEPIIGPIDADGNGTIQGPVDYNGNGSFEALDYDGDGNVGEWVENTDWDAGTRTDTTNPDYDYLNSLTVVDGRIQPGDSVVDFYENEWNDDLNHDGSVDTGIVGYQTVIRTVCTDVHAYILSPGHYTKGVIPTPTAGNYLVFLPGVYIFDQAGQNVTAGQNRTVRNGGGVLCTLPQDNPAETDGAWTYQGVKSYCDSEAAWESVCPTLAEQRDGATRCGALLHWVGFDQCGRSNPPELLSAGGNGETLLRQYYSGAAEGTELEKYDGFLLWFSRTHDPEPGCNASLRGGGASEFSGTIYGATTNLSMAGGGTGEAGSLTLQMIVQTIEFKGGSIFDFKYDEGEVVRYAVYGLVE